MNTRSLVAYSSVLALGLLAGMGCSGEVENPEVSAPGGSAGSVAGRGGGAGTSGSAGIGGAAAGPSSGGGSGGDASGQGGSASGAAGHGGDGAGGSRLDPQGGSDAGPASDGGARGDMDGGRLPRETGSATDARPREGGSWGEGKASVCNFASGLNIAWVRFANDVPNPNLATFRTIFQNTHTAGGRIIRWWLHTNGTVTPGYDASGKARALQPSHTDGVKAVLAAAHDADVAIVLSLWSFDMLQDNAGSAHTNNQLLLENDNNRQAYVDNYLTPLVTALRGTPGLYAYEIFNEPEGMGPKGWATYRTTEAAIQKTVNWFAAAIHTVDPDVLVTNGAQTFDYSANVSGKNSYYSDEALRKVGGKQNGTLDFYQVHYYTSNGVSNSPFKHPASYWGLDKKLVMGEFTAQATDGVAQADLMTYLYSNGYAGAWPWSYVADWPWPSMQVPIQSLFKAHPDVGNCP